MSILNLVSLSSQCNFQEITVIRLLTLSCYFKDFCFHIQKRTKRVHKKFTFDAPLHFGVSGVLIREGFRDSVQHRDFVVEISNMKNFLTVV